MKIVGKYEKICSDDEMKKFVDGDFKLLGLLFLV